MYTLLFHAWPWPALRLDFLRPFGGATVARAVGKIHMTQMVTRSPSGAEDSHWTCLHFRFLEFEVRKYLVFLSPCFGRAPPKQTKALYIKKEVGEKRRGLLPDVTGDGCLVLLWTAAQVARGSSSPLSSLHTCISQHRLGSA